MKRFRHQTPERPAGYYRGARSFDNVVESLDQRAFYIASRLAEMECEARFARFNNETRMRKRPVTLAKVSMKPQYPKSLLGKRTPEQYEFDQTVKGWAFTHPDRVKKIAVRARAAYEKIQNGDKERLDTLLKIEEM